LIRIAPPLLAGYLVDRIGPYRVIQASWALGIIAPLLMLPAPSWGWAIPGLALYAASAFAIPSVSAYVLMNAPEKRTPGIEQRLLTSIFAAYAAGLIVSPLLGGELAQRTGSVRACLIAGEALFLVSLGILLLARPIPPLVSPREDRPIALQSNRGFVMLACYFGIAALILFTGDRLIPNYLEEVRGFTRSEIGILYSILGLGTVIANMIAGRVHRRWNYPLMLSILWLALFGVWQGRAFPMAGMAFLGMGALWSARALSLPGIASTVKPGQRGLAFGAMDTLIAVALAGASQLAGVLYSSSEGHDLPFMVGLIGIPVLILLWLPLRSLLGSADGEMATGSPSPASPAVEES
jgi:predicted MFS family arabinose efflux permease